MTDRGELAPTTNTPENMLLLGICGSTAYGLAGPDSDVDRIGCFAARTEDVLSLSPPAQSVTSTSPDIAFHEAAKFANLLLKCNPTVIELLWLPEELYEVRTLLGSQLIGIRGTFLSQKFVRDAYLGYATQQFKRIENRGDGSFSSDTRKRTAKHARHLLRLLVQGKQLHTTGELQVRVDNPEMFFEFGECVAAGDLAVARDALEFAELSFSNSTSPLPERVNSEAAEAWLQAVRREFYT